MEQNIHDYENRIRWATSGVHRAPISAESRRLILEHDAYLVANRITIPRRLKYLEILKTIGIQLKKPFGEVTKQDLERLVGALEAKPFTVWTKNTYRIIIKRFWKWLKEAPDGSMPPEVAWIKTGIPKNKKPLPRAEDLLTEEDIQRLLQSATRPRDKALISILWETGARISEIGTLTFQDVRFDKHGAVLSVRGKTGSRTIRIIQSVPHLANWMQLHPSRESTGPLWVATSNGCRGQLLSYNTFRKILIVTAKAAGIAKRVNPHGFRHARATYLATHLTEFQMNQVFGWSQGSDMPSTYVHLSGKDTDNAILRLNGIDADQGAAKQSILKPRICARCDTINAHDSTFCRKCGGAVDLRQALDSEKDDRERDGMLSDLLNDDEVRRVIREALIRRKLEPTPALTQVKIDAA